MHFQACCIKHCEFLVIQINDFYLAWTEELEKEDLCSCDPWIVVEDCVATAPLVADTPTGAGAVLGRCLQRWRLKQK